MEKITNQLKIDDCIKAIANWDIAKREYSEVKKCIDPKNVFCFRKEDLEWIKPYKDNYYFQIFAGVYESKLVFVVAPVDNLGKVKKLESYLYLSPLYLDKDLKLTEQINIEQTSTLSVNYQLLKKVNKKINLLIENDPSITENQALKRIQAWLEQSLDWFYYECNDPHYGKRIFKTFKVPLIDLKINQEIDKVYCFLGFKYSYIHNMQVPVLNFIAVNDENCQVKIEYSNTNSEPGNMADFSSPCPPFCRDGVEFSV